MFIYLFNFILINHLIETLYQECPRISFRNVIPTILVDGPTTTACYAVTTTRRQRTIDVLMETVKEHLTPAIHVNSMMEVVAVQ